MGVRYSLAKGVGAATTWGLQKIFRRPASNFPGKLALYVDPKLMADLRARCTEGSIVISATNGKTTTTNMIANMIERAGKTVICNREGANLDSGIATTLLHSEPAQWGVFECDEMWVARVLPGLQCTYLMVLNLFPDQMDRFSDIDVIVNSMAGALAKSPNTTLIYNGDDPNCVALARRVKNPTIAFGIGEDLGLPKNLALGEELCRECGHILEYDYRQYAQLGAFHCVSCSFARPELDAPITGIDIEGNEITFTANLTERVGAQHPFVDAPWSASFAAPVSGAYMVYNMACMAFVSHLIGVGDADIAQVMSEFSPKNARLERMTINGRDILMNLAKNPTGFNQNLRIITRNPGPCVAGFFINDAEGDGRDVSWIWEIDFEGLLDTTKTKVYAGGVRVDDLVVRLKYAGIDAEAVESAADMIEKVDAAGVSPEVNAFVIANFTALTPAQESLHALQARTENETEAPSAQSSSPASPSACSAAAELAPGESGEDGEFDSQALKQSSLPPRAAGEADSHSASDASVSAPTFVMLELLPDVLNIYGDTSNAKILAARAEVRGIEVERRRVGYEDAMAPDFKLELDDVDLVILCGGGDRALTLALPALRRLAGALRDYIERDGALLAFGDGYQLLGSPCCIKGETLAGLGVLPISTVAPQEGEKRLVSDAIIESTLTPFPIHGYENHEGRTTLDAGAQALGRLVSSAGKGQNGKDKTEGVAYRNAVGTYLHGPVFSKSPEFADLFIERALASNAARHGVEPALLEPLDDSAEMAARAYICKRMRVALPEA